MWSYQCVWFPLLMLVFLYWHKKHASKSLYVFLYSAYFSYVLMMFVYIVSWRYKQMEVHQNQLQYAGFQFGIFFSISYYGQWWNWSGCWSAVHFCSYSHFCVIPARSLHSLLNFGNTAVTVDQKVIVLQPDRLPCWFLFDCYHEITDCCLTDSSVTMNYHQVSHSLGYKKFQDFMWKGTPSPNHCWCQKLECFCYLTVKTAWSCLHLSG